MKAVLIIICSFLFLSCSSVNEKECTTMNWFKRGAADAKKGLPKSKYGEYKEACLRYGISFDKEEYVQGYESGK